MIATADGWAVLNKGEIDVKTVGSTRRGALVNWLYVNLRADLDRKTDDEVEHAFHMYCDEFSARVSRVTITVKPT